MSREKLRNTGTCKVAIIQALYGEKKISKDPSKNEGGNVSCPYITKLRTRKVS